MELPDKKLLSKRVQFDSIESVIDEYLPQFVNHFKLDDAQTAEMRRALVELFKRFMLAVRHAVNLGADKGIEEALNLMCNPDFYETVKKRKAARREEARQFRDKIDGRAILQKLITDTETIV